MRKCPHCKEEVKGRSDKKFCSTYCKSSYHYHDTINNESNLFRIIDKQLRLNRRLLKNYNKSGKSTVRKDTLLKEGFNPKHFTHYWKNQKGNVYLFCYEFGFFEKYENGKLKYVLVQWQNYMK